MGRMTKDQGANVEHNLKAIQDAKTSLLETFNNALSKFRYAGNQYSLALSFDDEKSPSKVPVCLIDSRETVMLPVPRASFVAYIELRRNLNGNLVGTQPTGIFMTCVFTVRTHIQERLALDWSIVQGVYQKLALLNPQEIIQRLQKKRPYSPMDFYPDSYFAEVFLILRTRFRWIVDYQRDPPSAKPFRLILGQREKLGIKQRTSATVQPPDEYEFDFCDGPAYVLEPLHTRNTREMVDFFEEIGQVLMERLGREEKTPLKKKETQTLLGFIDELEAE